LSRPYDQRQGNQNDRPKEATLNGALDAILAERPDGRKITSRIAQQSIGLATVLALAALACTPAIAQMPPDIADKDRRHRPRQRSGENRTDLRAVA
jgi:hypothetical protein